MTLDEAIKHTEKITENKENLTKIYKALNEDRLNEDGLSFVEEEKCAEEHRQLVEWLKDYKRLLEQAQPKTGHWRPIYQGDEIIDYRCSECEFGNTFGKSTHGMNYCPHCGAKMEEE